jgi:hypothetical protein
VFWPRGRLAEVAEAFPHYELVDFNTDLTADPRCAQLIAGTLSQR